jgi:hypothetical protein
MIDIFYKAMEILDTSLEVAILIPYRTHNFLIAGYKIIIQKSVPFLYANELSEK